jgi:hypothetical protein
MGAFSLHDQLLNLAFEVVHVDFHFMLQLHNLKLATSKMGGGRYFEMASDIGLQFLNYLFVLNVF